MSLIFDDPPLAVTGLSPYVDAAEPWPKGAWPNGCTFRPFRQQDVAASAHGSGRQSVRSHTIIWRAELTFRNIARERADALAALIERLDAARGRVLVPLFDRLRPGYELPDALVGTRREESFFEGYNFEQGYGWIIGRSVTLKGALEADDTSLTCVGLPASSDQLGPNYAFSINGQAFTVSASEPATVNRDGEATISFSPPVRRPIEDGRVIELAVPVQRMQLISPDPGRAPAVKTYARTFELTFEEA